MGVRSVSPQAAATAPVGAPAKKRVQAGAATGWRAWYELTKPKIVQMMLVTCLSGMVVAEGGLPPVFTMLWTCLGLGLSIGGASALNHVLDRDLDRRMARTSMRPVACGTISAEAATAFGVTLFALGGWILCMAVNPLTAWTALAGGAFYVAIYTPLKRVTSHNTVLGGVAGAMPPVVGWVAVTNDLSSPLAWTLFAIMFLWQPAHFWPLSLLIREDYAKAGFKMLPVTHGERVTVQATWRWTWLSVVATFVPVATGDAGWIYLVGAIGANAYLARRMWALVAADRARGEFGEGGEAAAPALIAGNIPGRLAARNAFLGSLVWLGILFVALMVDALALSA